MPESAAATADLRLHHNPQRFIGTAGKAGQEVLSRETQG